MNIYRFNNLKEFNDYLINSNFLLNEKFNLSYLDKIVSVVNENVDVYANTFDGVNILENLGELKKLEEKAGELQSSQIKKIMRIAANVFSKNQESIEEFENLRAIDQNLYYQTLGYWIAEKKIPLQKLNLTEGELLECAPWLTWLELEESNESHFKFTEEFIGKLLNKTKKLTHLIIKKCDIEGKCLEKFTNTDNLENLQIRDCGNYNHEIPEKLPNIKNIIFDNCKFNKKLPDNLPNLENLIFVGCDNYNQKIPRNLKKLKTLHFFHCGCFNQNLPGKLSNLENLLLYQCYKFNGKLPKELPKAKEISIYSCPLFNQNLPKSTNLESLELDFIPAFKPFEHSLNTLLTLNRFEITDILDKAWSELSSEEKKYQIERVLTQPEVVKYHLKEFMQFMEFSENQFLAKYPEMKIFFELSMIEKLLKFGDFSEELQTKIESLKKKENFLEYLYECIQSHRRLTSYFLRKQKETIKSALAKMNLDSFPRESQLVLLPLLQPKKIQKLIANISDQEKKQWLAAPLNFDQFSGKTSEVLKEFHEINLKDADCDEELHIAQELLEKIPLKTLAAFAEDQANSEMILNYRASMDETELAVVIPFINSVKLLGYLKKQSIALHLEILKAATEEQRASHLKEVINFFPSIRKWKATKKELKREISLFIQNPSKEKIKTLETQFVKISHSLNTQLQQYNLFFKALDQILSSDCPSQGFLQDTVKILLLNAEKTKKIHKEEEQLRATIAKLPKKILNSHDEIPEEFIDQLTNQVMKDPWTDEHGNTLDKTTWDQCIGVNPYTRKDLQLNQNLLLKKKIEQFFKEHHL